jgi:hypothetical protein
MADWPIRPRRESALVSQLPNAIAGRRTEPREEDLQAERTMAHVVADSCRWVRRRPRPSGFDQAPADGIDASERYRLEAIRGAQDILLHTKHLHK